ncbi:hypothetical protein LNKW23_18240 [Paralimibaculum aggregatum]|uniref:HTH cro/C1-type domain-containing protein n=1 Tax=Paralimibaculum aggregatum TaxID=3036245 RepID=A0ABQ6LPY3_9RHOB|nr:helix-turn-helix transcriptional regulator [Limibaculum sp. NKW23]GMG82611.1 hypothetical protein LNKW23_18240 [Limibaculum sp. NKW23]
MEPHERLRQIRTARGFDSAAEAARHFGWNPVTLRAHEGGQNDIRREMALEYARAFRVSPCWLLFGGEEPAPGGFDDPPDEWESLAPGPPQDYAELMARAKRQAPNIRHPTVFDADGRGQPFGLPRGGLLIVDETAAPRHGQIVVITTTDDVGQHTTRLGRYLPPYVVGPGFSRDPEQVFVVDGAAVWIKGPVMGVLDA